MEVETVHHLIADWTSYRDAAAALLLEKLHLASPRYVLRPEHRGRHDLDGTQGGRTKPTVAALI
jgi:hypothetical protein